MYNYILLNEMLACGATILFPYIYARLFDMTDSFTTEQEDNILSYGAPSGMYCLFNWISMSL